MEIFSDLVAEIEGLKQREYIAQHPEEIQQQLSMAFEMMRCVEESASMSDGYRWQLRATMHGLAALCLKCNALSTSVAEEDFRAIAERDIKEYMWDFPRDSKAAS